MHAKCTFLLGFLLLLSCSSAYAANEEIPAKLRGLWANSKETCDVIRTAKDLAYVHDDAKWLKLTATDVLGSTQGRFFRGISAQMINGAAAELSFEMQSLDEPGAMMALNLSADGRLHETVGGTVFLFCSSVLVEGVEFPQRSRGFWADKKGTCDVLRTKGPASLREDQMWLKISATNVLGWSQGRVLQERRPAQMVNRSPAQLSFEIQLLKQPGLPAHLEDLTLSLDGRLYETIVGARASGSFERCQIQVANDQFPQEVRGFWTDTKETCAILKAGSPNDLRRDQRWLKLTAEDVIGTTQARFLREMKIPAQMVGYTSPKFGFEVQLADWFGLIGKLSFTGDADLSLYETIVGAHGSRYYSRC